MKHCTQCGHLLGLGRFCTNCGSPVAVRDPLADDWRESTAERAAKPTATATPPPVTDPAPRVPPVAGEPPPPPRFPLFADEVETSAPPMAAPVAVSEPVAVPEPVSLWAEDDEDEDWDEDDWDEDDWDDEGRPRIFWIIVAVAVLAVLVVGAWFLGQQLGGEDDNAAKDPSTGGSSITEGEPVDHTADASAEAPSTTPPGEDVDGQATSYDASNMLDGVPETAWRMEGDGTGEKLVFTFAEKTRITQVGLINGYAKKARDGGKVLDWYEGHRRIQQVLWIFADGKTVKQSLTDTRELQTIDVDPIEVKKVVLKILATSEPGDGAARRDMTAISDVLLAEN